MATRLYLPISGTPPLSSLGVDSQWERSDNLSRLPCYTTKQNTALTTSSYTWQTTSTGQWVWRQWQTETMSAGYSWTTSDTVSMVIGKCAETSNSGDSHLAYCIRVVSADGTTVRGQIGFYGATSTEYPLIANAATRIHNARTGGAGTFSSSIGDRIIIEIGLHGVTPALESIQMRFGDPSATSDFALTAALTTDLVPWVELSRTVAFGNAPVAGATNGKSLNNVAIINGHVHISGATNGASANNVGDLGEAAITSYISGVTNGQSLNNSGVLKGKGSLLGVINGVSLNNAGILLGRGELCNLVLGSELVTQNAWYTAAYWDVFQSGWSQSDTSLVCDGTVGAGVEKSFALTMGARYRVVELVKVFSGDLYGLYDGAGDNIWVVSTSGLHYHIFTAGRAAIDFYSEDFAGIISTLSTKQVTGAHGSGVSLVSGTLRGKGELMNLVLGSELFTYNTFDAQGDWLLATGVTIADGRAHFQDTYGTLKQDLWPNIPVGHSYRAKFQLLNFTGTDYRLLNTNSGYVGIPRTANGVYVERFIATGNQGLGVSSYDNVGSTDLDNFYFAEITGAHGNGVALVSGTLQGKGELCNLTLGSNVILNSTFETTGNWDLSGTGGVITGGEYVVINSNGAYAVTPTSILTVGIRYRFKYILRGVSGEFYITAGNTAGTAKTTNGLFIDILVTTDEGKCYLVAVQNGSYFRVDDVYSQQVTGVNGVGVAIVSGTLQEAVSNALRGTTNGTSLNNAGTLLAEGILAGVTNGLSTNNKGTLAGKFQLSGVINGASLNNIGLLQAKGQLQGVINGTSANNKGTIVPLGTGPLFGVTNGTSLVSLVNHMLIGYSNGVALLTGTLVGKGALEGITEGYSYGANLIPLASSNFNTDGTGWWNIGAGTKVWNSDGYMTITGADGIWYLYNYILSVGAWYRITFRLRSDTLTCLIHSYGGWDSGIHLYSGPLATTWKTYTGIINCIGEPTLYIQPNSSISNGVTVNIDNIEVNLLNTQVLGALQGSGNPIGATNGTSLVQGNLQGAGSLQGSVSPSTATVTGTILAKGQLGGSVEGYSLLSGTLHGHGVLAGQTNGIALCSARPILITQAGSTNGIALLSGTIYGEGRLQASTNGLALITGDVLGWVGVLGNTNGIAVVSGTLEGVGRLISAFGHGVELIDQGNWYTSSYWNTFGSGWSQSGTTLVSDGSISDNIRYGVFEAGKTYYTRFTVLHNSGDFWVWSINGVIAQSSGTFSGTFLAGHNGLWLISSAFNGTVTALSIRECVLAGLPCSGTLTGVGALEAIIDAAYSEVSGTLGGSADLQGEILSYAQITADLNGWGQLNGDTEGLTSTIANLNIPGMARGETNGVATIVGDILGWVQIAGETEGVAYVEGVMWRYRISEFIIGNSTITPTITDNSIITGQISDLSTITATITENSLII